MTTLVATTADGSTYRITLEPLNLLERDWVWHLYDATGERLDRGIRKTSRLAITQAFEALEEAAALPRVRRTVR